MFFGAKLFCDKVVTDIVSYRSVGDKGSFDCAHIYPHIPHPLPPIYQLSVCVLLDEYVRISVLGVMSKYNIHVSPTGK